MSRSGLAPSGSLLQSSPRTARVALAGAVLLLAPAAPAAAQTPSSMLTVESPAPLRYAVTVPEGCRHEVGPGTVDAVCAAEFDADKSAQASAVSSIVLEASAEGVPAEAGMAASALAAAHTESAFKAELPETVCGETDAARVKIENVKTVLEADRVAYTASVLCPEVKFLALGERRASVRFLVTPGVRYRLVARAPADAYEQHEDLFAAFLSSLRVLPAG